MPESKPEIKLDPAKLEALKVERGRTDDEFAADAGLSLRQLQRWISGDSQPTWNVIVRAARSLDVEPASLIVSEVHA